MGFDPAAHGKISELQEDTAALQADTANLQATVNGSTSIIPHSSNLLDISAFTTGYQMASTGYFSAAENVYLSPFIDVTGMANIVIRTCTGFTSTARACFYNSTNVTSGNIGTTRVGNVFNYTENSVVTYPVPAGAKYFRFQVSADHYANMVTNNTNGVYSQVQSGTTITVADAFREETTVVTSSLPDRISAVETAQSIPGNAVDYWGDSLTQGNQDGTGVSRPSVMAGLLGATWTIHNYGVGGEQSNTIACRQGGMNFLLKPGVTIPAAVAAVEITSYLVDQYGVAQDLGSCVYSSAYNAWGTVNPCTIAGITGNITRTQGTEQYYFTRLTAGTELAITRPTAIITNSSTFDKNNVLIIWIGQNQGYDTSAPAELVAQIRSMIDFAQAKRYLIIGLGYSKTTTYSWQVASNASLKLEFGRHYIDVEEYLKTPIYSGETTVSSYALSDSGITPTEADLTAIAANEYPPSILHTDNLHYNQYGYTVIAKLEFARGQELGYW